MTEDSMSKEDKKRFILRFLVDTGLSLPPKAIHHNLDLQIKWDEDTTKRLLGELVEEGYVVKDPDGSVHGYYEATNAGERFLRSDDGT